MNHYYWHQHDTNKKSSRSSSNQDVPDDIRNPSFHQNSTTSWSTQRHLPPSPIQTSNSFDGYGSPLPACTNAYDPRGTNSHAPAKNIFEGYYEHPAPRYPFEAMEANYFSPSPFPVHPEGGIHTCEGPSTDSHPYVSHTVYWFDPHLPSSNWHTMYKADPTADRKPSPRNLTSPIRPFFDSMDPEPSLEATYHNVPPVASGIAPSLSSTDEESSTKRKPANKRKQKAEARRARPLSERGNHQHASAGQEELDQIKTIRAKKAMASWYDRYNELVDYNNDFGDTNVPQQYPANHVLGIWVNKQRMEMKAHLEGIKCSMTDRRIDLLQQINFEWAKPKGQAAWDEKFKELFEFQRMHGDCHVPTKHKSNRPLGRWVSTQRHMKKKYEKGNKPKSLDHNEIQRRIAKLEALGFAWSMVDSPSSIEDSP